MFLLCIKRMLPVFPSMGKLKSLIVRDISEIWLVISFVGGGADFGVGNDLGACVYVFILLVLPV